MLPKLSENAKVFLFASEKKLLRTKLDDDDATSLVLHNIGKSCLSTMICNIVMCLDTYGKA